MSSPDRMRLRRLLLKSLPMSAMPVASLAGLAQVANAAEPASGGRPISLVLPFPPGGSVDIVARQLQPGLKTNLGQTVVVDNKPGAGGLIASNTVARAKPDALIMQPGPMNRGVEIASDIADHSRSVIREQVEMGVAVRMAVLEAMARQLPNH